MHVCDTPKSVEKCCTVEAGGGSCLHIVRGACQDGLRCRGGGFCAVATGQQPPAGVLGAGSPVGKGNRRALSAGGGTPVSDGSPVAPRSGFERHGGRPALWWPCCCGGRDLGGTIRAEFYRHPAAGAAGRSARRGVLADPAGGHRRAECGAQSLAGGVAALGAAPRRCAGPGRSALAGGIVPLAFCRPRRMGGAL